MTTRKSIKLKQTDWSSLQKKAAETHSYQQRGPVKGKASWRSLLMRIARGEVLVVASDVITSLAKASAAGIKKAIEGSYPKHMKKVVLAVLGSAMSAVAADQVPQRQVPVHDVGAAYLVCWLIVLLAAGALLVWAAVKSFTGRTRKQNQSRS